MKSWENEIDERFVADVKGPQCLPITTINVLVCQVGSIFETWISWGKKNWQIASGTLEQMNAKRDRINAFAADPFAPAPSSVADFVGMAKSI